MNLLVELRERNTAVLEELDTLWHKESRTADDESRLDALLAETNDLGPKIDREVQLEQAAGRKRDLTEPNGHRVSGIVPHPTVQDRSAPNGGVDVRSLGRRFVESEQYKRAVRTPLGLMKDDPFDVAAPLVGPDRAGGLGAEEVRALISAGTPSASWLLPQVVPGIYRAGEAPLVLRDVLMGMTTSSDAITVLQETAFTNAAVEVAEATLVSEGAKPESAMTFAEVTFPVRTIAHWIPITRQTLEDVSQMESYVNQRLLQGLARREDNQFLNGTGVAPNLTGILATSGIQLADATHFTANPTQNSGTDLELADRIRRGIRLVEWTALNRATFIVMNPADTERMDTLVGPNGSYVFGGPAVNTVQRTYWGRRVVESANIAALTALVGDGSMAAVADRQAGRIYTTDSHSDFFIRNIFVILAEERVALPVFRPAAFCKVTLPAA